MQVALLLADHQPQQAPQNTNTSPHILQCGTALQTSQLPGAFIIPSEPHRITQPLHSTAAAVNHSALCEAEAVFAGTGAGMGGITSSQTWFQDDEQCDGMQADMPALDTNQLSAAQQLSAPLPEEDVLIQPSAKRHKAAARPVPPPRAATKLLSMPLLQNARKHTHSVPAQRVSPPLQAPAQRTDLTASVLQSTHPTSPTHQNTQHPWGAHAAPLLRPSSLPVSTLTLSQAAQEGTSACATPKNPTHLSPAAHLAQDVDIIQEAQEPATHSRTTTTQQLTSLAQRPSIAAPTPLVGPPEAMHVGSSQLVARLPNAPHPDRSHSASMQAATAQPACFAGLHHRSSQVACHSLPAASAQSQTTLDGVISHAIFVKATPAHQLLRLPRGPILLQPKAVSGASLNWRQLVASTAVLERVGVRFLGSTVGFVRAWCLRCASKGRAPER